MDGFELWGYKELLGNGKVRNEEVILGVGEITRRKDRLTAHTLRHTGHQLDRKTWVVEVMSR